MLVDALRQVLLVPNPRKTKNFTTQSQHPAQLVSPGEIAVEILALDRAHKWLGRTTSTHTDGSCGLDPEHHLQAAPCAFYANKPILCDKSVSISQRLAYFGVMVPPKGSTSCMFCRWPPRKTSGVPHFHTCAKLRKHCMTMPPRSFFSSPRPARVFITRPAS